MRQQTVVTPLKKRRDYRRLSPGEEAVDRLGFPFTDHTKRLKMPLKCSWRRTSTTDDASVGSRPSETSRELFGIGGSSATTRSQSQTFGGSSSCLPSTPKTPATQPQTPATQPRTPVTQPRTPTELQVYGERPASSHLSSLLPTDGERPMATGRRLSTAVPRMEDLRSLSR